MRGAAIAALAEMGPAARSAISALTQALKDEDVDVRRAAALALGAIEEADAATANDRSVRPVDCARLAGLRHAGLPLAAAAAIVRIGQIGRALPAARGRAVSTERRRPMPEVSPAAAGPIPPATP